MNGFGIKFLFANLFLALFSFFIHGMDGKCEQFPFKAGKNKCESLLQRCSRAVLNKSFNEEPIHIVESFKKLPLEMREYLGAIVSKPLGRTLETRLHRAQSSFFIKQLVAAGAQGFRKTVQGYTPLLYHIKSGQREEALAFIEVLPADRMHELNDTDDFGRTALDLAYDICDAELIESLKNKRGVSKCVSVKREDANASSVLGKSVKKDLDTKVHSKKNYGEGAAFLLKNFMTQATFAESVNYYHTLDSASQKKIKTLICQSVMATGLTPLHLARTACDVEKIFFLDTKKCYRKQVTIYNESPLHTMIQLGNLSAALKFIQKTDVEDYDYADRDSMAPLDYAVKSGSLDLVSALIKKKGVHKCCEDGSLLASFRFLASHKKKYDLIDYMMENIGGMKSSSRFDLMCLAIEVGNPYLLTKLLPKNSTLDTYRGEQNLLCYAITNARHLVVLRLLDGKVKMAQKKISEGSKELQKYEIIYEDVKVNVSHQNADGLMPLMIAAEHDAWYVLQLLKAAAAIEDVDNNNNTALFYAVNKGNRAAVKLLIEKGAQINHHNSQGKTPLHCAALNNDIEIARLLLENGADITCTDNKKKKPQDYASDHTDKRLFCEILGYEKNWWKIVETYIKHC